MTPPLFSLQSGNTPLLVSLPHVGTMIPEQLQADLVPRALYLEDTDWHLDRLYDFVPELGASLIVPGVHRYVIDLNRHPEGKPLYAGKNTTGLCPTTFFDGERLYRPRRKPRAAEIERRVREYWQPYHDALQSELDRLRTVHGHALLLDGHSIKSELPWLFAGRLPDLNLGTAKGRSCDPSLREALSRVLASASRFTHVVDGRFTGGFITRQYGRPEHNVHAVQLEMCWSCYMAEQPPFEIDECRAIYLRPVLKELVAAMLNWARQGG